MIIDDEKDALAAEYVLGTLDPDERAEALALIAVDEGFATLVTKWERRLGELNVLVASVEPPPELWDKIKALVSGASQSGEVKLPGEDMPKIEASAAAEEVAGQSAEASPAAQAGGRKAGVLGLVAGLLVVAAAALGALVVAQLTRPEVLPLSLRPKPIIHTVEVIKKVEVPSPRPAQFVSVLQKEPFAPDFLVTFDWDRKTVAVRAVGAARAEAGKSYELWLMSEKLKGPHSIGVVGAQEFTVKPAPLAFDTTTINDATYAVSVEPEGGSKSGSPTGPILYSGKLIQTTPPGFPAQTP